MHVHFVLSFRGLRNCSHRCETGAYETIQNNQMLRGSSKHDNLQIAGLQSEVNWNAYGRNQRRTGSLVAVYTRWSKRCGGERGSGPRCGSPRVFFIAQEAVKWEQRGPLAASSPSNRNTLERKGRQLPEKERVFQSRLFVYFFIFLCYILVSSAICIKERTLEDSESRSHRDTFTSSLQGNIKITTVLMKLAYLTVNFSHVMFI